MNTKWRLTLLCTLGLATASTPVHAAAGFDSPTEVRRVSISSTAVTDGQSGRVSCFYFPRFMIKEIDLREKGAEQLSIAAFSGDKPPCGRDLAPREKVIPAQGAGGWSGYFKGVKGEFVFFDGDDGVDSGVAFAVFRGVTGEKIFADSAYGEIDFPKSATASVALRYDRVYHGPCSIPKEGKPCWEKIKAEIHSGSTQPPDCEAAYEQLKNGMARDLCGGRNIRDAHCVAKQLATITGWDESPSVIAYPVRIEDLSKPRVMPTGTNLNCWPAQ